MPGIVGIIAEDPTMECQDRLRSMLRCMMHEPFYVSGTYFVSELGIYAGWVAHEDSFAAGQVFLNEKRDVALILAGECFVDPEIRIQLRAKGHIYEKDTDWLVHLYEEKGERFFEGLNGLFSGLLIDKRQKKAFLFNDRYGAERLYWHETKGATYFASEAKALLRALPELRAFDKEGVAQFLVYGCTLEGRTLFQGIQRLPGASLWSFERGRCQKKTYFSPETWESQLPLSVDAFLSRFEEKFKEVLPRYFESRATLGISLTAGLDSRMIMACRPEAAEKPVCYTFSGENQDTLDARLAARLAQACGLEHEILRIDSDFFSEFGSHCDRTIYITDGTLGVLGAHEIYFNKQARRLAPVRLTGVFGGEILRGVSMFKPIRLDSGLLNPDLRESLSSLPRASRSNNHPITFAAFHEIPDKRFGTPAASRSQVTFRTPYLDNEIVALAYQVPESLRTSPAAAYSIINNNSTRLSEIPTDMGLLGRGQGLAALPERMFLKATFKLDYFQNEGLPHWLSSVDSLFKHLAARSGVLGLHKFLYYRRWFQRELAAYITDRLTDARTLQSRLWNSAFLKQIAREHTSGRKNYVGEIDTVLTLEAVGRLLFHDLPGEPKLPATSLTSSSSTSLVEPPQRAAC